MEDDWVMTESNQTGQKKAANLPLDNLKKDHFQEGSEKFPEEGFYC